MGHTVHQKLYNKIVYHQIKKLDNVIMISTNSNDNSCLTCASLIFLISTHPFPEYPKFLPTVNNNQEHEY